MIVKLLSGYTWEYVEDAKTLCLYHGDEGNEEGVILIPRAQVRSLGCFVNRVAWHRSPRKKAK